MSIVPLMCESTAGDSTQNITRADIRRRIIELCDFPRAEIEVLETVKEIGAIARTKAAGNAVGIAGLVDRRAECAVARRGHDRSLSLTEEKEPRLRKTTTPSAKGVSANV